MYKLRGVIFSPASLALESSLVLPPHMVKLGHLVGCDEEQAAKCRVGAVQPDLCLSEEKQEGGSVAGFFPFRGWRKSRLGWSEESWWVCGAEELLVI